MREKAIAPLKSSKKVRANGVGVAIFVLFLVIFLYGVKLISVYIAVTCELIIAFSILIFWFVTTYYLEMNKKSNRIKLPTKSLYIFTGVTIGAVIWVNIGQWTKYGLQIKLSDSYIPTLINGITTSTSIIIAIFIAVLSIMLRFSIEKKDAKSTTFYLLAMIALLVPIAFFWSIYAFLTQGLLTLAVTYSLSALIGAFFICVVVVIVTIVRISNQTEEEEPPIVTVVRVSNQTEKDDPTIGDDF